MRTFGLIGYPLSHSFSRQFFTDKFRREQISGCEYLNFPLPDINAFATLLQERPGIEGINVTIPYKEQVIPFLDEVQEVVEKTGACNCIKIVNGKLTGYNTDVVGFEKSLSKKLAPHHTQALVLGTGGAAKAVEYVLRQAGISCLVVSRTPDRTKGRISYEEIYDSLVRSHPLIINTTPLGMFPNVDAYPPLPYAGLTPANYLFDLVYNPSKTRFLQQGEERGAAIMNGSEMLEIQAEESWRIWNSE